MPRVCWSLRNNRPSVQVNLIMPFLTSSAMRTLLADTGAGSRYGRFEVILSESDCRQFQIRQAGRVYLGGAYTGNFPRYIVRIEILALGFGGNVSAVAVPDAQLPLGFDGIAGFRFLNRFTYGNLGAPNLFCLEIP